MLGGGFAHRRGGVAAAAGCDVGDGVGDLPGVISRLEYLADLGVDAIWLSPFYPSPWADGGYDVSDYRDVDPRLGTLADFQRLTDHAHDLGLRVIVDIVPNHTSDRHPWFQDALASPPGAPARDRYIFRPGQGERGDDPPTDWRSHFGGSAWQRVRDGEWYCHLFAKEQPDLNWSHPEVREYFRDTLRFWADLGVDGFRIDVAHSLAKDLSEPLRSQPNLDQDLPVDGTDPLYDREEVHTIYQEWRQVFDEYDPPRMAVAETWYPASERTYVYARPTGLGQVFDFSLLKSPWDCEAYTSTIERTLRGHEDAGADPTWVLSSHDVPRHATRLGLPLGVDLDQWILGGGTAPPLDHELGRRRARAATLMMLALPGSPYLYQGEELGLPEVADLPVEALQDPVYARTGGALKGRDGCRVPIPWTKDGPSFGFGTNGVWLPQPEYFGDLAVQAQSGDPSSTLEMYRKALGVRRRLAGPRRDGARFRWSPSPPGVLSYQRGDEFLCMVNMSMEPQPLPRTHPTVLVASNPFDGELLPPDHAVWLGAHGG